MSVFINDQHVVKMEMEISSLPDKKKQVVHVAQFGSNRLIRNLFKIIFEMLCLSNKCVRTVVLTDSFPPLN